MLEMLSLTPCIHVSSQNLRDLNYNEPSENIQNQIYLHQLLGWPIYPLCLHIVKFVLMAMIHGLPTVSLQHCSPAKACSNPSSCLFHIHTSPKAPRPITFRISKSSLCSRICFTLDVNGLAETKEISIIKKQQQTM